MTTNPVSTHVARHLFSLIHNEDVTTLSSKTTDVISKLQTKGINPILYGSQGASLYLGHFKQFGDIDLLVENSWIEQDWEKLIKIMNHIGYKLVDEHEHEFSDQRSVRVAFASKDILIRDGVTKSLNHAFERFSVNSVQVDTLKPELFKRVYEFSAKDGYRRSMRSKKDKHVITLLDNYLKSGSKQQVEPS